MQPRHWLAVTLIAACLLLVVVLAKRGFNSSSKKVTETETGPVNAVSWKALMDESAAAYDLPQTVMSADSLLSSHEPAAADSSLIRQTLVFLQKNDFHIPAARYEFLLAQAVEQKEQWLNAGEVLYNTAVNEVDSSIRNFLMSQAILCFDSVLQTDADHSRATLIKGLALTDRRETMMQGVPLLLQVVRKDPENIPANYTLALLAIESGQYDKALSRFQKLISLQPSNPEYYYHAGIAHQRSGNREEALQNFKKSMELAKDEETKERIQQTIDQLN